MNYLLEIVIFNVVIFTICGISMAKKGKIGMIQEYPKAIQDRCRELGLIQESSDKLTKKATIGKVGFLSGICSCKQHWRIISAVPAHSLRAGFTDISCG